MSPSFFGTSDKEIERLLKRKNGGKVPKRFQGNLLKLRFKKKKRVKKIVRPSLENQPTEIKNLVAWLISKDATIQCIKGILEEKYPGRFSKKDKDIFIRLVSSELGR